DCGLRIADCGDAPDPVFHSAIRNPQSAMGLAAVALVSGRSKARKSDRLRDGVQVHDAFDSKASDHLGHPPGVVAVRDGLRYRGPRRLIGKTARIVTTGGTPIRATIDDARDHGTTIRFFFKGLS